VDRTRLGQTPPRPRSVPEPRSGKRGLLSQQIGFAEQDEFPGRFFSVHAPFDIDFAAEFPRRRSALRASLRMNQP
jgi:hypothetical protein